MSISSPAAVGLYPRTAWALAVAMSFPAYRANASSSAWVDTATKALQPATTTQLLGAAPAGQSIHVAIGLTLQNRSELADFLVSIRTPGNPAFGNHLTPSQFTARYSPTAAQAQTVVDYLTASGFTHIKLAPNRLVVSADGTVGAVQKAFNTQIQQFNVAGKTLFANGTTAQVPDTLGNLVTGIMGLQNLTHRVTGPVRASTVPAPAINTGAGTDQTLDIIDFPIAYDAKFTPTAAPYALFMYGDVRGVLTDLRTAEANNGLDNAPVSIVLSDGVQGTDTSGADEWDLDSQSSRGMAGEPQLEIWYVASTGDDAPILESYNRWVTDDLASGASASFGDCELDAKQSGEEATDDPVFMEAVAQGQTLFSSSGDTGAGCSAVVPNGVPVGVPDQSYPGISDYALEVGGTDLNTNADFTYGSESAWEDGGGGVSLTEPLPSWQSGVVRPTSQDENEKASCDVSADADPSSGANVVVSGAVETVGGTSLSSPLTVAAWARVQAANGNTLGFAGPVLYNLERLGIAAGSYDSSITGLRDVTKGQNVLYRAQAGYDYPTGLGSIDICMMATLLGPAGGNNYCTSAAVAPTLVAPVAELSADVTSGTAPLTVTFDGSNSTTSNSGASVSVYDFQYGDGTSSGAQSASTATHTYTTAGSYSASLVVTDSDDQTSTNTAETTIVTTSAPNAPSSASVAPTGSGGAAATSPAWLTLMALASVIRGPRRPAKGRRPRS